MGLGPFVKFLPASGRVGSEVGILGNSLKGATSVTFNGTAAKFTVALAWGHFDACAKRCNYREN
jgi:NADPH-dependent curcumin reductase CurA